MAKYKIIAAVAAVAAVYLGGSIFFQNNTFPKTELYGIETGVMNKNEATQEARQKATDRSITIKNDNEELGTVKISYAPIEDTDLDFGNNWAWPAEITKEHKSGEIPEMDSEKAKESLSKITSGGEEPKNAYVNYEDGEYKIIPETEGTVIDQDKAWAVFNDAYKNGAQEADVTDCKKEAEIKKDNEDLNKFTQKANRVLQTKIEYKRGDKELVVSNDEKNNFLDMGENGEMSVNREKVLSYALKTISGEFDSTGNGVSLTRPDGSNLSVSGGNWGYNVDSEKEADRIVEALKEQTDIIGEPIYKQNGGNTNSYVEVDIENQKVHVVVDGQEKLISDCVTGNTSTGHGTHTGAFYIYAKLTNWTMVKYNAFVKYWMPFNGDEGLHDASWRSSFGGSIYKTNGSHGCTNLPYDTAKFIYDNCPQGTLVVVH